MSLPTPTMISGYQGQFVPSKSTVIAMSGTKSAAIHLAGFSLCGIQMPAAFTGSAITFEASVDGTTFQPLYSTTSGTALSYTVAAAHFVAVDPKDFQGVNYLKIVSGSSEAAARTLLCAMKGF